MHRQDLRFTDTNSADDSKGRTWGLEGNLFWYLAGGMFASVVLMLILFSTFHLSFMISVVIAAVPCLLTLIYVFGFRQGKPPCYDRDCFEYWVQGRGFGPEPQVKLKHPTHV
jgi:hypothetical protein